MKHMGKPGRWSLAKRGLVLAAIAGVGLSACQPDPPHVSVHCEPGHIVTFTNESGEATRYTARIEIQTEGVRVGEESSSAPVEPGPSLVTSEEGPDDPNVCEVEVEMAP